ncbi:hypothetical protein [Streptomyces sp. NPDC008121]|uniref:aromatic-ring hydroxylase C-terminal domain-containing protein n=1 Tax=Streptomyces sp. NPDC008121 TaxID=3364809 RepID=UPI0036E6744E
MTIEHQGKTRSTIDLYEQSFILLSGLPEGPWHVAARDTAQQLSLPLVSYCIGARPGCDLHAGTEDWATTHGVTSQEAVLIRPDGMVAWRCPGLPENPGTVLRSVLESILSR